MKIFLINLDKRPDRLSYVASQLHALQLDYERLSAIDGEKLNIETIKGIKINQKRHYIERYRYLSLGEIGCFLSHYTIWKKIIDLKLDYALILEDDITIDPDLPKILVNPLIHKFDLINLSSNHPYHIHSQSIQMLLNKHILNRPFLFSQNRKYWRELEKNYYWLILKLLKIDKKNFLCECTQTPAMTSGYIISAKAAKYFIKASKNIHFPVDNTWRHSSGFLIQAFLAEPLIIQTLGDTNIENRLKQKPNYSTKILHFFYKSLLNIRQLQIIIMYNLRLI